MHPMRGRERAFANYSSLFSLAFRFPHRLEERGGRPCPLLPSSLFCSCHLRNVLIDRSMLGDPREGRSWGLEVKWELLI